MSRLAGEHNEQWKGLGVILEQSFSRDGKRVPVISSFLPPPMPDQSSLSRLHGDFQLSVNTSSLWAASSLTMALWNSGMPRTKKGLFSQIIKNLLIEVFHMYAFLLQIFHKPISYVTKVESKYRVNVNSPLLSGTPASPGSLLSCLSCLACERPSLWNISLMLVFLWVSCPHLAPDTHEWSHRCPWAQCPLYSDDFQITDSSWALSSVPERPLRHLHMNLPRVPRVQHTLKGTDYLPPFQAPCALLSSSLLRSETSILYGVLSNVPHFLLIAPLNQSICLYSVHMSLLPFLGQVLPALPKRTSVAS